MTMGRRTWPATRGGVLSDVRPEQAEARACEGKLALNCDCFFSVSTVCQAIHSRNPVASSVVLAFKQLLLIRCSMKCPRGACVCVCYVIED
ncbi:hypothetical protein C2845_PM16G15250 [Panicum miliaceum]|uniref:Uncharacterized protein n=1 Tax=Panicum miliaceum TaxID=4540 RepID=A0A3L6PYH9_PANMI|nr:hypothetical protein C2845_PM16G15250 [Panicum miliaceum]